MKRYLIFSDETEKKLAPLTHVGEIKLKRQRGSRRKRRKCQRRCLNMAKLLIFTFSKMKIKLFSPGCLWKELAYSWPACFENLSPSLFHSASVHAGVRGKNTPSGQMPSNWHSRLIELTVSGAWPGKWTGHNEPLTWGSPSVTHTHTHTHRRTMHPSSSCYQILIRSRRCSVHPPASLLWLD